MAKNNDDQSGGAESFDFAPKSIKKINGPESRFGKTEQDSLIGSENLGAGRHNAPHLQNATDLHDSYMDSPPDPYGEDLSGSFVALNYQILEKVGEGGMSSVYRARHAHLNREVAVKMLHPHLVANRVSRERFSQEARAVSQIEHPSVVRVLDFGISEENRPYIVMDFLQGNSLAQTIRANGPLDIATAIDIFVQLADALAYTHDLGIIHRDLKPSNIILLEKPGLGDQSDKEEKSFSARIVDFGIAKLLPHEDSGVAALTQTGDVFGSPLYMSPEQAKGEKLDNRSDIYSMGCLMYESLTGVPPINGSNLLEILYRHMNELPPPMKAANQDEDIHIPKPLEAIVFKALAKDAKDRYQDMRSLEADLQKFGESGPGLAGSVSSIWSIYRSRRKRLNAREKIAIAATSMALLVVLLSAVSFLYLDFKGSQDFSELTDIPWYISPHKTALQNYTSPRDHLITFTTRAANIRIQELEDQVKKSQSLDTTDSDYEIVQALVNNAFELKGRDSLDSAEEVIDKAIALGSLVHGPSSQIVREAMAFKLMVIYQNKKYAECVALIHRMQSITLQNTLYQTDSKKALIFSVLGESEYQLKQYEKAQTDLLVAIDSWAAADAEKEKYDPALIEIRALATSYFADCFAQDKMWPESIKYYQRAFEAWKSAAQPIADYNQALALFKESVAYCQCHEYKKSGEFLNQALDLLHRQPKDFYFYQTGIEMMQISGRLDQEHGNWLSAAEKFIQAGLAKNRSND